MSRCREIFVEALGEIDQCLKAKSHTTCLVILPRLLDEIRTGDVEMRPGCAFWDELLQEQPCCDRSRDRAADVVEIGAWRLQHFLIFLGQRKLPELLAVVLSRVNDRACEF